MDSARNLDQSPMASQQLLVALAGVINGTSGFGGTGGAIAPPIFLKIGEKVVLSTPNISG